MSCFQTWSAEDEAQFDAVLYELAKAELWKMAKEVPALKARGANGIRSHLDAKVGGRSMAGTDGSSWHARAC